MIASTRLSIVVSALLSLAPSIWGADEPPPARRVLVLTNDSTFAGIVEQEASGYRVKNETGELVIPAKQVVRVCESLDAAYELLKSRANLRDPHERLRLARWCWNQNLLEQARAEADAALQLAPKFVEAQRLARNLADARPVQAGARTDKSSGSTFAVGHAADSALRSHAPRPITEHAYNQETLQSFTRKIQPILFNSCATAQCHGGSLPNGFTLHKPFGNGGVSAQMTRQNLLQTLNLLDKEDPAGAPLLRKAVERHGGGSRAPLGGKDSPAYQALEAWVFTTCGEKPAPATLDQPPTKDAAEEKGETEKPIHFASSKGPSGQSLNPRESATAPTVPFRPRVTIGSDGRPVIETPTSPTRQPRPKPSDAVADHPSRPAGTPVFQGGEVVGATAPEPKPGPGRLTEPARKLAKEPPRPVDPFDPVQFNRQHHPERS
jgi:hypothetical protein